MVRHTATILLIILGVTVRSEWVDLPQFSDDSKVYYRRSKFSEHLPERSTSKVHFDLQQYGEFSTPVSQVFRVFPVTKPLEEEEHVVKVNESVERPEVLGQSEVEIKNDTLDSSTSSNWYCSSSKSAKDYCDFLPVNLLGHVHETLKSQPRTFEGKMRFLKTFEQVLLKEIESRLNSALSPFDRKRVLEHRRFARDSHHEKEDKLGFPSVEGALMTISFLTFAVYLVRLVMQLFHKVHENASQPSPIFLGKKRKKRGFAENEETFTEKTVAAAEILRYIEESKIHAKGKYQK